MTMELNETTVREALRGVIDPELDCNLVDLGLVYGVDIQGNTVRVWMTLTTAGCPMHESLVEGVRVVLMGLDGVRDARVEVVWDPPWQPSMMTPYARARLGVRS
jgi:metal-sulfur cluster biosynthetic enzyme